MKKQNVRRRHIAIDVLATICGGFIGDAVRNKSWISGIIGSLLFACVFLLDRIGIDAEEHPQEHLDEK